MASFMQKNGIDKKSCLFASPRQCEQHLCKWAAVSIIPVLMDGMDEGHNEFGCHYPGKLWVNLSIA